MRVDAFIALGSNLDQPLQQVRRAARALRQLDEGAWALSPLYASRAVGPGTQPDYVNAVARIATSTAARTLLGELQRIERAQGRERGAERWTARTLDLDLLLYGDQRIEGEDLSVPHPRIAERAFVLVPLHDLAPALRIPGAGALAELLARTDRAGVRRLPDTVAGDA